MCRNLGYVKICLMKYGSSVESTCFTFYAFWIIILCTCLSLPPASLGRPWYCPVYRHGGSHHVFQAVQATHQVVRELACRRIIDMWQFQLFYQDGTCTVTELKKFQKVMSIRLTNCNCFSTYTVELLGFTNITHTHIYSNHALQKLFEHCKKVILHQAVVSLVVPRQPSVHPLLRPVRLEYRHLLCIVGWCHWSRI